MKIVFTKPKKRILPIFSWIIRLLYKTESSHVAVILEFLENKVVYHAQKGSTRLESLHHFKRQNTIVDYYSVTTSKEENNKIKKYILRNLGKKYAYLQNLGILIDKIFRIKDNVIDSGDSRVNCSEEVLNILRLTKLEPKLDKFNPDLVSPRDLKRLLRGLNEEN
jgi:hypothetical protein